MARIESSESHALTRAGEDYLEAIYVLSLKNEDGSVRSVDVAEDLDVSKASVNKALSMLKDQGMVNQEHYGKVTLTDEGRAYARLVWRAHRALKAFLIDEIGVDEETANEEACLMEHALSHDTMIRWISYLEKQGFSIGE